MVYIFYLFLSFSYVKLDETQYIGKCRGKEKDKDKEARQKKIQFLADMSAKGSTPRSLRIEGEGCSHLVMFQYIFFNDSIFFFGGILSAMGWGWVQGLKEAVFYVLRNNVLCLFVLYMDK